MTPLEKRAEELAEAYSITKCDTILEELAIEQHFKSGFKEFKDQPEVMALVDSLKFCLNNFLDIPVEKAIPDGILTTGRIEAERALKAWGEFVGDQALRGADEKD